MHRHVGVYLIGFATFNAKLINNSHNPVVTAIHLSNFWETSEVSSINRPISFRITWYNIAMNRAMNRAEKRSQKRKEVVEAVALRKEPVEVVARIHNIPLRTVFDWLARYRQGGWHALIEKNRQGRPKKITGDDMKWLYDAITMGNPLNYKLPFCLWSSNNIRALLQKERAVNLSKSSICRLLGHLGLTPQKPLYKSYKQDPRQNQNLPQQDLSRGGYTGKKISCAHLFSG